MYDYWDDYGDYNDDWNDMKTRGPNGNVANLGALYGSEETGVDIDGWVGEEDPVDYLRFTLNESNLVYFTIGSTGPTKFSLYTLSQDKKGNYSLKTLQTVTVARNRWNDEDWDYASSTVPVILKAGEYYFSVTSTNAKSGGEAEYYVGNPLDYSEDLMEYMYGHLY